MTGLVSISVTACGQANSSRTSSAGSGTTRAQSAVAQLDLYASLPLTGTQSADGQALLAGIKLAIARIGREDSGYRLRLIALDDSMPGQSWAPAAVVANAKRAALDPDTIAYIGELASGASKLSMPILSEAGIAQISPGSAYVGLTNGVAGVTAKGEPALYSPAATPTFARMLASDAVQAAAMLTLFAAHGCKQVAVAHGTDQQAEALAALLKVGAPAQGISSTISDAFPTITAADIRGFGPQLRTLGDRCVALVMKPSRALAVLTTQLMGSLARPVIIGDSELCTGGWTVPANAGQLAGKFAPSCVSPLLPLSAYPGHAEFQAIWQRAHPAVAVGAWQLLGYASAQVPSVAIAMAGREGDNRQLVRQEIIGGGAISTVLGTISFDSYGNSSLTSFAVYRLVGGSRRRFLQTVTPTQWPGESGS